MGKSKSAHIAIALNFAVSPEMHENQELTAKKIGTIVKIVKSIVMTLFGVSHTEKIVGRMLGFPVD